MHRSGGKFTPSHSTVTDSAAAFVDAVHRLPQVTKISLGIIEKVQSRESRLKFTDILAGLKVAVYGRGTVQIVTIYTKDKEEVKKAFENF